MPDFRRAYVPGGTFFFTVVTYRRRPIFLQTRPRGILRGAITSVRAKRPFDLLALVLLPDHLHCLWALPPDDQDFSTRWRRIKEGFTRRYLAAGGPEAAVTSGQARKGLRGVWQQRFWEHTIRNERDFQRHMDYIHYNPVKHGHTVCPHAWAWSTFANWVKAGAYAADWCCQCDARPVRSPDFTDLAESAME